MERITTAGICFDKDKRVLIAKRIDEGPLALKWEFPGGKNRYGESIEDTLRREWQEELGKDIRVLDRVGETEFINNDTKYYLKAHIVELLDSNFTFSPVVHSEFKFVPLEELKNYEMGDSDSELREQILAKYLK